MTIADAAALERARLAAMLRAVADGYNDDRASGVPDTRFSAAMRDTLRGMAKQIERDGTLLGDDTVPP